MTFDEHADVVVIGSGAAGCAAAIAAARSGLQVVQLEKAMALGGSTTESYGLLWVPNWSGAEEDLTDAIRYLRALRADGITEEVARQYCVGALAAVDYLAQHGVEFESLAVPDHHYPDAPGSRPGGRIIATTLFDARRLGALQPALGFSQYVPPGLSWSEVAERGGIASAEAWDPARWPDGRSEGDYRGFGMSLAGQLVLCSVDSGVDLRLGHHVTRLVTDGGRVVGCQVTVSDGSGAPASELRIGARRGVVIATNGIEGNRDLMLRFEDLPDWETHYPDSCDGEGLLMATEVGGGIRRNRNLFRQKLGYRIPAADGQPAGFRGAGIQELAAPHTVVVNRNGRRFADESRFHKMAHAVTAYDDELSGMRNFPCYLLMDSAFFKSSSFAGRAPGAAPPEWLTSADTLAELAALLDIDARGLEAEIEDFNRHATAGVDPRFDRGSSPFSNLLAKTDAAGNPNLGPLETPPFYGVPLVPTGKATIGIDTDEQGRVLTLRNEPVPGLYACGAAAPTIDRGPAYQAGLGLGQGLMMGCTIGWALAE